MLAPDVSNLDMKFSLSASVFLTYSQLFFYFQSTGLLDGQRANGDIISNIIIYRDVLFEFHLKFWNNASIGIPVKSLL